MEVSRVGDQILGVTAGWERPDCSAPGHMHLLCHVAVEAEEGCWGGPAHLDSVRTFSGVPGDEDRPVPGLEPEEVGPVLTQLVSRLERGVADEVSEDLVGSKGRFAG